MGKTKILRGFLKRERIFHHEVMHQLLEAQARHNLAKTLDFA